MMSEAPLTLSPPLLYAPPPTLLFPPYTQHNHIRMFFVASAYVHSTATTTTNVCMLHDILYYTHAPEFTPPFTPAIRLCQQQGQVTTALTKSCAGIVASSSVCMLAVKRLSLGEKGGRSRPKEEKEEGINLGIMAPQKGGGGGGSNSFPSAAAAVAKVAVSKVGEANAGKKNKATAHCVW